MLRKIGVWHILLMALCLAPGRPVHAADGEPWQVSRSSGDVWVSSESAEPASLQQDQTLKPGETIRTGRSGRVLLVRGKETMLISPNSVVGLPKEKTEGLATTVVQQAGSILLDVEKQNV